jgi:ribosome maturation factor RimP
LILRVGDKENAMHPPIMLERLEESVEKYLEGQGYELVDLRITGSIGRPVIEIYCDIEGGITAEDCGKIARSLRLKLDAEGFFENRASLVVSSPGLDRVIKRERDFERFKGRKVKVWLVEPIGDRGRLTGVLAGYDNGTLHLTETEEGDLALAPGRWKEIRLVPTYPEGFK